MAGPRITKRLDSEGYCYQAKCCTGFIAGVWGNPWRSKDDLAIHLEGEHGIVKFPDTLAIGEVQD